MKTIRGNALQFVPASHENPDKPGVYKKVLAVKDDLFPGRVQMINWALLPNACEFSAHYHEDMEEVFIIIRGRALITVNEQSAELALGDAVVISPREVHTMRNIGEGDVEYLVVGIAGEKQGKSVNVRRSGVL